MKMPSNKQWILIGIGVLVVSVIIFFMFPPQGASQHPRPKTLTVSHLDGPQTDVPETPVITKAAGKFGNGEPFATYETSDFSVHYPDWMDVKKSSASGTADGQIFVSKNGCNVIVKPMSLRAGTSYRSYVQKTLDQANAYNPTYQKKEITDTTAVIDAEIPLADATLRNVAYNYLSKKGISYGIAFVAEKKTFDAACQPYLDEVQKSVTVK